MVAFISMLNTCQCTVQSINLTMNIDRKSIISHRTGPSRNIGCVTDVIKGWVIMFWVIVY